MAKNSYELKKYTIEEHLFGSNKISLKNTKWRNLYRLTNTEECIAKSSKRKAHLIKYNFIGSLYIF